MPSSLSSGATEVHSQEVRSRKGVSFDPLSVLDGKGQYLSLGDIAGQKLEDHVAKTDDGGEDWRDFAGASDLAMMTMEATGDDPMEKSTKRSDKISVTLPEPNPDKFADPNALGLVDQMQYVLENEISADPNTPFFLLAFVFVAAMLVFGSIWWRLARQSKDEEVYGTSWADAVFMHLQLIVAAGYDSEIPDTHGLRVIFFLSVFFGLVIFAILVGFITDSVSQFMSDLDTGRTKVSENDHTLILGWNEATMRVVVQCAFLRRQYQMLNESKYFGLTYYLPFMTGFLAKYNLLERPSTSLAVGNIVIMCDSKTKDEMHRLLSQTLSERGINPKRTTLGRNIICRVGDPTNTNDLLRVAAQRAAAIVVMMTEADQLEEDNSDDKIHNGATLRVCLALRHVIFSNVYSAKHIMHPELRIVLQMTSPSVYVDATNFKGLNGNDVIIPMDLSVFLNSLMFMCAAQPGLSKILLSILNFEGPCIRRRKAKNLRSGPDNAYGHCIGHTFGNMRQQFTKAIFVGIIRPSMPINETKANGFGLLPRPDIIIEEDDLLIFVGPKSSPDCDSGMVDIFNGYINEAKAILRANPFIAEGRLKQRIQQRPHDQALTRAMAEPVDASNSESNFHDAIVDEEDSLVAPQTDVNYSAKSKQNMLICGWRPVWSEHPERLQTRITEIVALRSTGSMITFVNFVEADIFAELMKSMDIKALPASQLHPMFEMSGHAEGVLIRHIYGDAAEPEVIASIIAEQTVHTVIVMGTQANIRLPSISRDTRVLNIMLLLRKFWFVKAESVPMHIVGENQQDMTAKLALGPRKVNNISEERLEKTTGAAGGRRHGQFVEHQPDFINTQAVFARAMAQTLAYPLIRFAVNELLSKGEGYTDVIITPAREYLPLGVPLLYGVVRALVLQARGERSICLGIMPISGDPKINPGHDKKYTFTKDDRLVILTRELLPGEADS